MMGTIIFWVIVMFVILVIFAMFMKTECDICNVEFSERAKKHDYYMEDKKYTICSKCKRRLDEKSSAEGVKKFLNKD